MAHELIWLFKNHKQIFPSSKRSWPQRVGSLACSDPLFIQNSKNYGRPGSKMKARKNIEREKNGCKKTKPKRQEKLQPEAVIFVSV